jgi:glycosyltransferase involved in cell wall biosynthesis
MRVLHVYSGNLYGGVETYLVTLARLRGVCPEMESEFALCFAGRFSEELQMNGARVHWLGGVRVSRPWTVRRARVRLRDLLQERNFDAVVCHSEWSQAIFGVVARRVGSLLVFHLHGATTGRHWLERWASHILPELVICNSRYTQSSAPHIYPRVCSKVIHCAVAPPARCSAMVRAEIREELRTAADSIVIIQVSRMESGKGHLLHLEALAKLRHIAAWTSWIAGGAQRPSELLYLKMLRRKAELLGIADRVRFLGERQDASRLLAAADIYCQPNNMPEGFGITFVEALYAGVPVVTTALGAAPEIVDDSCGMLIDSGDASALAQALESLIQEAPLRAKLGAQGQARAQQLSSPSEQIRAVAQLLNLAVNSRDIEACFECKPA